MWIFSSYSYGTCESDFNIWWPVAAVEKNFENQEKTFLIEKKLSELRKKIWNAEKYFRVKKKKKKEKRKMKSWNWEKKLKSRKIFQNREKYFKIEKNVSESRNILLQESRKNLESNDFQFNELYLFYKIKE